MRPAQVLRLRPTSSAPVYPGIIDGYTTNLWGAYGLALLRTTYSGPAIRVRRSSDNAEQDIGFVSGTILDTAALASFVGANSGFVTKFYDQSGGVHDLVQATAANQPMIVDAGTYTGELVFDGVNDSMATTANSGTPTAMTCHIGGRTRTLDATTNRTAMHHAGSGSAFSVQRAIFNSNYGSAVTNGGGGSVGFDNPATDNASAFCFKVDRAGSATIDECLFYANGTTVAGTLLASNPVVGNFPAGIWNVGYNGASQWAHMGVKTILIYETAQSNPDIASIAALIKPIAPLGALDSFTTNLWAAFGLRKHITAYSGSCLRIQRSSDSAQQDIGFVSGELDTASLLSFVGASNGDVVKWYSQTGSNDLDVATNPPRLVASGVLNPGIQFDGTNDFLRTTNNTGTPTAFTTYIKAKATTNTGGTAAVFMEHNSADTGNSSPDYRDGTVTMVMGISESAVTKAYVQFGSVPSGQVLTSVRDRTLTGSTNICKAYSGGIVMSGSSVANVALTSTAFQAKPWSIGSRNGSAPTALWYQFYAIYETAHTAATAERIARGVG